MGKHKKKNKQEDILVIDGSLVKKEPKSPKEAVVLPNKSEETDEAKFIFLPKRKIISKIQHGDLVLREFSNIDCDGATVIEGIPNEQESLSLSLMVSHYIVEQLKLPVIGEIYTRSQEPVVVVERGEASSGVRIYGNKNIVVFASETSLDVDLQHDIVDAILDFATRHRCKMILSVLGLDSDPEKREKFKLRIQGDEEEDPIAPNDEEEKIPQTKEDLIKMIKETTRDDKLYFCTNDKEFAETLMKMEHKPLQDIIVAGVSAGLLNESIYTNMVIACLFTKLNSVSKYISVDARAAISLIVCINHILGDAVIIDTKEMDKDVTKLEEGLIKIITRFSGLSSDRLDSHLYL